MTKNKLVLFLLTALVLSLFANAFFGSNLRSISTELGLTKRDYHRSSKRSQHIIDSLADLTDRSEARVFGLQRYIERHEDSLKLERMNNLKWKKAYVEATRTRVDRTIPDHKLDSLVTGLLTAH